MKCFDRTRDYVFKFPCHIYEFGVSFIATYKHPIFLSETKQSKMYIHEGLIIKKRKKEKNPLCCNFFKIRLSDQQFFFFLF